VAVKIIPKQALKKKSAEEKDKEDTTAINKKMEREIAIMKLIQHPHIMALYDVYETVDEL
jgi:serine/threonine protein kinase